MAYPDLCDRQVRPRDDGDPKCRVLIRYSDPDRAVNGNAVGVARGSLLEADNVERLEQTAATVAAYLSPANIVSVTVTDAQTLLPVDGVQVEYELNDPETSGAVGVTDAEGLYEILVPLGFSVTIDVTSSDHEFDQPTVVLSNLINDVSVNFAARPLFEISGMVADATGDPIRDIMIEVDGRDTAVTSSDGTYALQLPFGYDQILRPFSLAHDFTPANVDFSGAPIASDVVQDFVGTLKRHKISGTLTEFPGGQPIPNTVITGLPGEPVTDAQGRYEVELDHFWSGTFTPQNIKYSFEPMSRTVPQLGSPIVQDFEGRAATVAESDWPIIGQGLRHQSKLNAPNNSKFERWSYTSDDAILGAPVIGPEGQVFVTSSYDDTEAWQKHSVAQRTDS